MRVESPGAWQPQTETASSQLASSRFDHLQSSHIPNPFQSFKPSYVSRLTMMYLFPLCFLEMPENALHRKMETPQPPHVCPDSSWPRLITRSGNRICNPFRADDDSPSGLGSNASAESAEEKFSSGTTACGSSILLKGEMAMGGCG